MWFGDMVTCASAEDMWLNEGWAVWCESLFIEFLYGAEAARQYMRDKLNDVIMYTHGIDGGYFPVYGIPQTITYGNTVYEKGAQVTHTLRHYLGDDLFFSGIKSYLQAFAYKPASSCDLRDFLSSATGVDLNDFFDGWVFAPGFPHFSVSSFESVPGNQGYNVTVNVQQKMRGRTTLNNSNHLEITFLGNNWERFTDTIIFSGKQGSKLFHVPFNPVEAIADFNEKISDATIEYSTVIRKSGDIDFPDTYFKASVTSYTDTTFMRVTHNWVPPDSLKTGVPGLRLSENRYWKVEGIIPQGFKTKGRFSYNRSQTFDNSLLTLSKDSLALFYRKDAKSEWQEVPVTRQGNSNAGVLITDSIAHGEYTFGAWERHLGYQNTPVIRQNRLIIFPNPSQGSCKIETDNPVKTVLRVYDSLGKKVEEIPFPAGKHEYSWQGTKNSKGVYFFKLMSVSGSELITRKMIFE
jgi:aminopeptidase N